MQGHVGAVPPEDRRTTGLLAGEGEDRLDETEAEIRAYTIACEDEGARGDGGVVGRSPCWRVEEREIGEQEVEQGGGERVLRGEAVFQSKAPPMGKGGEFGGQTTGLGGGAGAIGRVGVAC